MSEVEVYQKIGKYSLKKLDWDFREEPLGLLLIWEDPIPGFKYVIGADTSEGLGQDRSSLEVNRVGTATRTDEQVAEWCGNVNGIELAPILYALANLYTVDGNEPMICPEMNAGGGVLLQEMRIRYNWGYFYQHRKYDKINGGWSYSLGWHTNPASRPKMLSRAIQQIKGHQYKINSPWLVDELSDFEYDAERMKMKAATNCHDDRVIASFISLYCSSEISDIDSSDVASDSKEDKLASVPKRSFQEMPISSEDAENYGGGMLSY